MSLKEGKGWKDVRIDERTEQVKMKRWKERRMDRGIKEENKGEESLQYFMRLSYFKCKV